MYVYVSHAYLMLCEEHAEFPGTDRADGWKPPWVLGTQASPLQKHQVLLAMELPLRPSAQCF